MGDGVEDGKRRNEDERGRTSGLTIKKTRTAIDNNPASVCLMVKFSSSKVLVP